MIPPVFAAHAALLQEPWCLTPDAVRRLTPRQVRHLYLDPAAERAERFEAGRMTAAGTPAAATTAAGYVTFDEFRAALAGQTGGASEEKLRAMYADCKTAWERENTHGRGGA